MKIKNVGFVEKHIEKLVLGAAGLFLLVVVWIYVVDSPYSVTVTIGSQAQDLGSTEIESEVKKEVETLRKRLEDTTPSSDLATLRVPDYTTEIKSKMDLPPVPVASYSAPLSWPGLETSVAGTGVTEGAAVHYVLPQPPAPEGIKIRSDFGVLASDVTGLTARQKMFVAKAVGDNPTHDVRYVSVSATFDMSTWHKMLRQGQDPPIPEAWWRSYLLVTSVVLERQARDPLTGQWGSVEVVESLPGQLSVVQVDADVSSEAVVVLTNLLRARQTRVLRPDIPLMTNDRLAVPPDFDLEKLSERQRQLVAEVAAQIREAEKQLERQTVSIANEVEDAQDILSPSGSGTPGAGEVNYGPGPGGPVGTGNPGGSGPVQGPGAMPGPSSPAPAFPGGGGEQSLDELQRRLKLLLEGKDIAAISQGTVSAQTPAAGSASAGPIQMGRKSAAVAPVKSGIVTVTQDTSKVRLLVHDFTVTPGQEYRYRVRVGVYNPLFRRRQVEEQQQKENLTKFSLLSDPSEWSSVVTVDPERRFFLVGASPEQRTTRWEVWRIFRGRWVYREFIARPGDLIGTTVLLSVNNENIEVPLGTGTAVVDLEDTETTMGRTTKVMGLNLSNNTLFERLAGDDRDNTDRIRMRKTLETSEPASPRQEGAPPVNTPAGPGPAAGNPSPGGPAANPGPAGRPPAGPPAGPLPLGHP